jgi:hypothetical protein
MVPGISDQLLVFLMILVAVVGMVGFLVIDGRRLDARVKRERESAAAEPRPEK